MNYQLVLPDLHCPLGTVMLKIQKQGCQYKASCVTALPAMDNLVRCIWVNSIHYCVLQVSHSPEVLWSGWYADDCTIHAPFSVLDHVYSALVSLLAACNVMVNPTKSRVVTFNVAQVDLFPNLRGLRKVPLHDGFCLVSTQALLLKCFWRLRNLPFPTYVSSLHSFLKLIWLMLYYVAVPIPVEWTISYALYLHDI